MVAGEPMDVCVPTGNFGNVLGAYYARRIGVPIGRLLVAANENNVLADFIATGLYDISDRQFVTTPSPSMDILLSSNLERLLYELTGDPCPRARVDGVARQGRTIPGRPRHVRQGPRAVQRRLRGQRRVARHRSARSSPRPATCSIRTRRSRGRSPSGSASATPCSWSRRRTGPSSAPTSTRRSRSSPTSEVLPDGVRELSGVELLGRVQELAGEDAVVPKSLAELDERTERFTSVVSARARRRSRTPSGAGSGSRRICR